MDFGGVDGVYATPFNTIGLGDVIGPSMGHCGSGDRFDMAFKKPNKKRKVTSNPDNISMPVDLPLIVYSKK